MYLNIIKAIYDKLIANILLHCGKTETISPKVRNEARVLTLPIPTQHSPGIPSKSSKARRHKRIQIGKEVVKLPLFTDDMILYLKDPKIPPKYPRHHKQLQQFCILIAGYKINLQKSVAFIYTTKTNLHVQSNSHQNPNDIHLRD
jgi:hypothetical protein